MSEVARWAVTQGQIEAEDLMVEHFVIDRPIDTSVGDDGRVQTTYSDPIYDGIGRVKSYRPYEQSPDTGGSTTTVQRTDWYIPAPERMTVLQEAGRVTAWAGPVQAGDRIRRVTAGKPVKTVRVAGEHDMSFQTAQRLPVDEITGGAWS